MVDVYVPIADFLRGIGNSVSRAIKPRVDPNRAQIEAISSHYTGEGYQPVLCLNWNYLYFCYFHYLFLTFVVIPFLYAFSEPSCIPSRLLAYKQAQPDEATSPHSQELPHEKFHD